MALSVKELSALASLADSMPKTVLRACWRRFAVCSIALDRSRVVSLLKRSFLFLLVANLRIVEALSVRFARADDLFSAGLPIEPRGAGRLCSTTDAGRVTVANI